MAERGVYDPKKLFLQTNASDIMTYRKFMDLAYSMPMQREAGVARSVASAGGEVEWVAKQILETHLVDTLKFMKDEFLEIREQYPGEFDLMADAHALEEMSRDVIGPMLKRHGAKLTEYLVSLDATQYHRHDLSSPQRMNSFRVIDRTPKGEAR